MTKPPKSAKPPVPRACCKRWRWSQNALEPTDFQALSRWQFLLVKQPICRRQAVTKSTGCAKAHRAKMASKSAILGQRDNASQSAAAPARMNAPAAMSKRSANGTCRNSSPPESGRRGCGVRRPKRISLSTTALL